MSILLYGFSVGLFVGSIVYIIARSLSAVDLICD